VTASPIIADADPAIWWQRKPKAMPEDEAEQRIEKLVRVVERVARKQIASDRPAPEKVRKTEVREAISPLVDDMPGFDWMAVYRAILIELERRNRQENAEALAISEMNSIIAAEQDEENVIILLLGA
jgi:hypothetical protein